MSGAFKMGGAAFAGGYCSHVTVSNESLLKLVDLFTNSSSTSASSGLVLLDAVLVIPHLHYRSVE